MRNLREKAAEFITGGMSQSGFMHFMRWFSALLVVLNHLRSILFVDFQNAESDRTISLKFFYFATSFGHTAVIVFFVLSGYLIVFSVLKQAQKNSFDYPKFYINRISRLYSVLPVALILTAIFDWIGSSFDRLGIYRNTLHLAVADFSVAERLTTGHFLSSLLMLQNIHLAPFGSNGPLWSLNYEFWYYILFPCLFVPAFAAVKNQKISYGWFMVGLLLLLLLPTFITFYFLVWLVGAIAIFLKIQSRIAKMLLPLLLIGAIITFKTKVFSLGGFGDDLATAILFALWLCCFPNTKIENGLYKASEKLASFSYTLYLIHLPLALCALTLLYFAFGFGIAMQPTLPTFIIYGIALLFIYLISYLTAIVTEYKTPSIKTAMEKALLPLRRKSTEQKEK